MRALSLASGPGPCSGLLLVGMIALLGTSCSDPEPPPVTTVPAPVPDPTPPPPDVQPEAQPDPAAGRCASGFTQNEATAAFSILAEIDAGPCSFEGVRASGSRLNLRWKDGEGADLKVTVGTAGCDDGQEHGTFTLSELPPGFASCGQLKNALIQALDDGLMPTPTRHERDGPNRPGPDGDGVPDGVRPPTIAGEKASPEQLPPAVPPGE